MSWNWNAVQAREAEAAAIWDKKGSIGWNARKLIGTAADGFIYDADAKKAENLNRILEKMNVGAREELEPTIGIQKTKFFDRLKAGFDEEQALVGVAAFDDYMDVQEPAPVQVKKETVVDTMDLDAYDEVPSGVQAALNFLESLSASIKQE
jgi:hypothetical protein